MIHWTRIIDLLPAMLIGALVGMAVRIILRWKPTGVTMTDESATGEE